MVERFYEREPEIKPAELQEIIPYKNERKEIYTEPIFKRFLSKEEIKISLFKKLDNEGLKNKNFEFKPLDLETNRRNQRVDEFILERMREPFPRVEPQAPVLPPSTMDFVSPTGFTATTHAFEFPRTITVKGQKIASQDDKYGYTEIHFTPGGRSILDALKMTDSLTKGIQGVVELLEAIEQGKFEPAQLFVGVTNINMALITQRLGFTIVDECRTPDGQIDRKLRTFTVVGRLEDIRARVEKFKKEGVTAKLSQRSQRLQERTAPQLARG